MKNFEEIHSIKDITPEVYNEFYKNYNQFCKIQDNHSVRYSTIWGVFLPAVATILSVSLSPVFLPIAVGCFAVGLVLMPGIKARAKLIKEMGKQNYKYFKKLKKSKELERIDILMKKYDYVGPNANLDKVDEANIPTNECETIASAIKILEESSGEPYDSMDIMNLVARMIKYNTFGQQTENEEEPTSVERCIPSTESKTL